VKRLKKIFVLLILFMTVLTTSVFAATNDPITTIYMTDAEFSTIPQDTFSLHEVTPSAMSIKSARLKPAF
jgi:hypothetical protein